MGCAHTLGLDSDYRAQRSEYLKNRIASRGGFNAYGCKRRSCFPYK